MRLRVVTQPIAEPVSVAEVTDFMRLNDANEQYLGDLISVARAYCEDYQKRAYITQTLEVLYDVEGLASPWRLELPRSECLQSVEAVKVDDITVTGYSIYEDLVARIVMIGSDTTKTVKITYKTGRDSASDVDIKVKHAIKMLTAHYYEHRIAVSDNAKLQEIPLGVKSLLNTGRVISI